MINERKETQNQLEVVMLENLVPKDHILRELDKYIDFSFIRDITKDLYCIDNGRPGIDPVMLFKMIFIGYLFGIRSERQLIKDIEVNVAYRWFLGLSLTEKVPNASTISQNRRRRFKDTDISQQIFDNIVMQAIDHNMVKGKVLYSDSTHIKANANKRKLEKKEVEVSVKDYLDDLDKSVEEDRSEHGKKPLKKKLPTNETKEIKASTTDPDSGYMFRDNKPKGFFYLDHRTVDSKYNIITDVHVTAGNVNDVDPYLSRLDRQIKRFGFDVKYVGLDAGYFTNAICKGIVDRGIMPVIAYRLGPHVKGKYTKNKFTYIKEWDTYACQGKQFLAYKTTTRDGYKEYSCNESACNLCHKKDLCLSDKVSFRTIRRHVWEEYKELNVNFMKTDKGKGIYKRRKETIERSFADSKNWHGLRYCRMRGIKNVSEQCLLTAAVQNMKKIAKVLSHLFFQFKLQIFNAKMSYICKLNATA
jgi:Transposase and inactivated derivatives